MLKQRLTLLSEVRQRKYALFMLLSGAPHRLRLMNCAWGASSCSILTELQVSCTLTSAHGGDGELCSNPLNALAACCFPPL